MADPAARTTELSNIMAIQLRRATAARWTEVNPTLVAGQPGYETDTGNLKIGTGTDAWLALPYAAGPDGLTQVQLVTLTSEQYDALDPPDPDTLYDISDSYDIPDGVILGTASGNNSGDFAASAKFAAGAGTLTGPAANLTVGTAAGNNVADFAASSKFAAGAGTLTGPGANLTIGTAAGNNVADFAAATDARLGVLQTWVFSGANNNGTITWPAGATHFSAILIGAGGGGGSGAQNNTEATRTGGQGGAVGGYCWLDIRPVSLLTSNTYFAGKGGAGAAYNGAGNNGAAGGAGSNTTFGQFIAVNGAGGRGGNASGTAPASTGGNTYGYYIDRGNIGSIPGTTISSVSAVPTAAGNNALYIPCAGGAGAGLTAENAGFNGGNAGSLGISGAATLYGAGGFTKGGNGGPAAGASQAARSGNAGGQSILRFTGSGGGGGASVSAGNTGGNGGNGGEGGGGGGGGGAANGAYAAGNGAPGGNGYLIIIAYGSNAALNVA